MAHVSFTINPEPTGLFFWITNARQILSDLGLLGKNAKTIGKPWKTPVWTLDTPWQLITDSGKDCAIPSELHLLKMLFTFFDPFSLIRCCVYDVFSKACRTIPFFPNHPVSQRRPFRTTISFDLSSVITAYKYGEISPHLPHLFSPIDFRGPLKTHPIYV